MKTSNVINQTTTNSINLNGLTESDKAKIISSVNKAKNKTKEQIAKELEKELIKLEKTLINSNYKGLPSVFNAIKKDTKYLTKIKNKSFKFVWLCGCINFNEFVTLVQRGAKYSINQVYKYAQTFQTSNELEAKVLINRGEQINAILMQLQKNEISQFEAIESFVKIQGLPLKKNKQGEKIGLLVNKSSAKFLYESVKPMYKFLNLESELIEFHKEFTTIKSEVTESELISA